MQLQVIEGTWEEIKSRESELVGRYLRVTVNAPKSVAKKRYRSFGSPSSSTINAPKAVARNPRQSKPDNDKIFGKYAFVSGSSDEYAKEKQFEIQREDRAR